MFVDKVEAEWAVDSKIDLTDLGGVSSKTLELHSKYFKYYNSAKARLRALKGEAAQLKLLKTDYYLGNLDHETLKEKGWKPQQRLVLKTDLNLFLDADPDIIEKNLKISELDDAIYFIDNIIRNINNRGFHVKNILENQKFLNGGY